MRYDDDSAEHDPLAPIPLPREEEPIDLDIHTIPERPGEPEHWHLDVRFVIVAPEGAREIVSDESIELAWFSPGAIASLHTDDSVRRLFALVFG